MRTQLNMKNIIGEKKEWKIEALGDVDAKEMEFRRMFSGNEASGFVQWCKSICKNRWVEENKA
uniref:Uncharacterized protein n=1 Tax=Meloidogyne incognita TaxID=6306 RepID=A0A914LFG5_MELIC